MKPIIKEVIAKSILTKSKLPNTEYVINPFSGCDHACPYCYAVFTRRFSGHTGEKWGSYVDIKTNAADLIRNIPSKRIRGRHVFLSSVTDPYQRTEGKKRITRAILQALVEKQPRLEILTKSSLFLRDLDVLSGFDDVTIGVSITTMDADLSRLVEPNASTPRARLKALAKARAAAFNTYVFISPILPYITKLQDILESSQNIAGRVMMEELNFKAGTCEALMSTLQSKIPGIEEKYAVIRKDPAAWWAKYRQTLVDTASKYGFEVDYYSHSELKGRAKKLPMR